MGALIGILLAIVGLGTFVCFIIVLIKLFKEEGVVKGILGVICSLYTFIWGWQNANRLNIKNIMMVWTVLLVVCVIVEVFGTTLAGSS